MVNETQYMILDRPYIPDQDVLLYILRRGTAKKPINQLIDIVTEAGVTQGVSGNDDLYSYASFMQMIEFEYGGIEADYITAHNNPIDMRDGWEGSGYTAPPGEPLGGLLPPE